MGSIINRQGESTLREELTGRVKSYLSGFLRVIVVALLVFLQLLVIGVAPFMLSQFTVYFYIILELLSFIGIVTLINDSRSPSYKIAWTSLVLLLPISGFVIYALWGRSDSFRQIEKKVLKNMRHGAKYMVNDEKIYQDYAMLHPVKARLSRYMRNEGFPLTKNNKITYFPMGENAFQDMFEELERAEKFILIDFFIVAEGAIWDRIHEILVQKVKQGVEVKFLYDDFGSCLRTEKHFKRKLEAEGIEVMIFNPIHKYISKLYMNYRSHQKIVVIDGNIGYTGGFNIADEYANLVDRFGIWKDNGIKAEGDAVWNMTITFLQMWEVCAEKECVDFEKYRPTKKFELTEVYCHFISDGPANNPRNPIESVYKQMISSARDYVYITTPYLIIEDDMKKALIEAVKGGLDVRLITPNIPDKKIVKMLTNYNYGALLKEGVRIFEYTPGFIHAKTIINEGCGIVGTINMDYRSFYLHYENGMWISNRKVVSVIRDDLLETMEESHEVTLSEWEQRPLHWRILQPFLILFGTLM